MPENKDYMIHHEEMGSIQISEDVVASIATGAALEVEHVTGLQGANVADFMGGKKMTARGVRVETDDAGGIVVNLFITVRYGCTIGDVAKKVQKAVLQALQNSTGFAVSAVNVQVGGISFN